MHYCTAAPETSRVRHTQLHSWPKVINRTSWSDRELEAEKMVHGLVWLPHYQRCMCTLNLGQCYAPEMWHSTIYGPSSSLSDQLLLLINFELATSLIYCIEYPLQKCY